MEPFSHLITPVTNFDEGDPLGIKAWSASAGISESSALCLIATILSGVAGPAITTVGGLGGCSIAIQDSDTLLLMAADTLLRSTDRCHTQLIQRSNGFSVDEIEEGYHEGNHPRNYEFNKSLGRPEALSTMPTSSSAESNLRNELRGCFQAIRVENLRRPGILLSGTFGQNMVELASRCHRGHAFAAKLIVPLAAGKSRSKTIDGLESIIRGVDRPYTLTRRTQVQNEQVSLRGIFCFKADDLGWVIREKRDLVKRIIPLSSHVDGSDEDFDEIAAQEFIHHFDLCAKRALAYRRDFSELEVSFYSSDSVSEFSRLNRAFLREMQSGPERHRVPAIDTLPKMIASALLCLSGDHDTDEYVLNVAFQTAREIRQQVLRVFTLSEQDALAQQRLKSARKMVDRVRRLGECTRRALVRGFDKQNLDHHEPVIQSLLTAGVFVESIDGILTLGSVPVESLSVENVIPYNS